jgi:hypothetical protein
MAHSSLSPLRVRNASRLSLAALTLFASLSAQAQQVGPSQDVYLGVGALSIATIGYARPINSNFGLRGEYAFGPTLTQDTTTSGADASASIKANRGGLFADWYPFSNGLRLVGGVTFNDISLDVTAKGTGGSTVDINGINASLVGQTFGASITFPTTTPYIGIGYGHHQSKDKGIGFYADAGLMVGTFNAKITTSVLGQNGITQADIDKESQSIRDKISSLNVLPSVSLGLVYRY